MQLLRRAPDSAALVIVLQTAVLIIGSYTSISEVDAAETNGRSRLFQSTVNCLYIHVDQDRLRCLEENVSAMDKSERGGQISVLDHEQIQEARRSLFGLVLPRFTLLDRRGTSDDEVSEMEAKIDSAELDSYGHWTLMLNNGTVWQQKDDLTVARRPRGGDAVLVKRGALGSFKMSITNQPSIRVRRIK